MGATYKLLTVAADAKTVKGESAGYLTGILYLAPFDLSGFQVCPLASIAGCVRLCLNTAGRGGMAAGGTLSYDQLAAGERSNAIQACRVRRTRWFINSQAEFMAALAGDIAKLVRVAARRGLTPVVRLNGTSDIRWEDIAVTVAGVAYANVFRAFPQLQYYDYTKIPNRRRALLEPNYNLTFSYSARPEFAHIVALALRTYGAGVNFAVVFNQGRGKGKRRAALPARYMGRDVIVGDENDLRFLDARGAVVALVAKGAAKADVDGMVVRSWN